LENSIIEKPYDLILMDWEMPGMDGIATSKRIKSNPSLDKIPAILMVTAHGREEIRKQADKTGLDGFLNKPVNRSLLFDTILEVFGKKIKDKSCLLKEKPEPIQGLDQIRGAKILLVEDNKINQQVAKELLEHEEFFVEISNNGEQGFERVRQSNPDDFFDAVLMDIQMPVMDGHTATREIRNLKSRNRNLPIIAMTAHAMTGEREKCLESGMNDYVSKPIDPKELFSTLVKWIKPQKRSFPGKDKHKKIVSEELLVNIAGIDIAEGLERIGGDMNFFRQLLKDFHNDYKDRIYDIREAVKNYDYETAGRIAHTLKGVGGNISANALFESASKLEKAINMKETSLVGLIENLETDLKQILSSIEKLDHMDTKKEKPDSKKVGDTAIMNLLLDKLFKMIREGDAEAKEIVEELKDILGSSELLVKLGDQIDECGYEEALEILAQLSDSLSLENDCDSR